MLFLYFVDIYELLAKCFGIQSTFASKLYSLKVHLFTVNLLCHIKLQFTV